MQFTTLSESTETLQKINLIENLQLREIIISIYEISSKNSDIIDFLISLQHKENVEIQKHLNKFFSDFKKKIASFELNLIEKEKLLQEAENNLFEAQNTLYNAEKILSLKEKYEF